MQWVSNQFATMSLLINLFVTSWIELVVCVIARNCGMKTRDESINDGDGGVYYKNRWDNWN